MSPQPLARVKPDARLHIGHLSPAGEFDAELCKSVAHVISLWSYVEAGLLRMASSFLYAEHAIVVEMLQAVKSSEGKRAAVMAAGAHRFAQSPIDQGFFLCAVEVLGCAETIRNRYAHHVWASSPDIPGSIILIDPRQIERATAIEASGSTERSWRFPDAPHFDRMSVMVYRRQDLEADVREAIDAAVLIDGLEEWCGFLLPEECRELSEGVQAVMLINSPRLVKALRRRGGELAEMVELLKKDSP